MAAKREYNEARYRATKKYQDARARVSIVVSKGECQAWKAEAETRGISVTQLIRDAMAAYL